MGLFKKNKAPTSDDEEAEMNVRELVRWVLRILAIAGDIITVVSWLVDILTR